MLTKPRSRKELCVARQDHAQVKNIPGILEVGLRATTSNSPQYELQGEECIEAQFCKGQTVFIDFMQLKSVAGTSMSCAA